MATTLSARQHGLPTFDGVHSEVPGGPKLITNHNDVPAPKPAQFSILEVLAQQCDVTDEAIQDAYPCTPFQTVRIRESIQVTGLRHSHMVYALKDEIRENIALFKRCWELAFNRNPILRTRIASLRNANSRETFVQVVVKDEFRWEIVDDTKAYQRTERFSGPLRTGVPLVYFAIDEALNHFVLTMHHALYDAYTLSLIWGDVKAAWNAKGHIESAVARPPYSRFIAYLQRPPSDAASSRWSHPYRSAQDGQNRGLTDWPHAVQVTGGVFETKPSLPGSRNVRHTAVIKAAWACTLMEAFKTSDIVFPDYFTGRCCSVPGILDIAGPTICAFPFRVQSRSDMTLAHMLENVQREVTDILKKEHWGLLSPNARAYTETNGQYALNVINVFQDSGDKQDNMWLNGLEPVAGEFPFRGGWDCLVRVIMQKRQMIWTFFADEARLGREVSEYISVRFPELLEVFSDPENHERNMKDLIGI